MKRCSFVKIPCAFTYYFPSVRREVETAFSLTFNCAGLTLLLQRKLPYTYPNMKAKEMPCVSPILRQKAQHGWTRCTRGSQSPCSFFHVGCHRYSPKAHPLQLKWIQCQSGEFPVSNFLERFQLCFSFQKGPRRSSTFPWGIHVQVE